RLINEYGPTETVVGCCVFEVPREGSPSRSVPLGRAMPSPQRVVLDSRVGEDGGRLYPTGDLAPYLGGGDLEYLGRIDNQVKIRGFRIELGEIEEALAKHPSINERAVIATEDHHDAQRS